MPHVSMQSFLALQFALILHMRYACKAAMLHDSSESQRKLPSVDHASKSALSVGAWNQRVRLDPKFRSCRSCGMWNDQI